jgi:hypothetical protein
MILHQTLAVLEWTMASELEAKSVMVAVVKPEVKKEQAKTRNNRSILVPFPLMKQQDNTDLARY